VSVGVSVRSQFIPVVLPADPLKGIAEVEHPGFQGRELEATEQFFDHFGLEQPRVPLLTPEFTNPLFLKLYCEGLKGLGLKAAPAGEAHISEVFARYLAWKAQRINRTLKLDPDERIVERAIEAFSEALAHSGQESIAREQSAELVNHFAPALHEWPKTLFGQMLSEGLLSADVAWDREARDYAQVVRFAYQRFADYRIAAALLEPYSSAAKLKAALRSGQPLRAAIQQAPASWIEAFSVLVPERFGVELLDAANWRLDRRRRSWQRSLVRSLVSRRPDAVSKRAYELMRDASTSSAGLNDEVFEAVLTVGPIPEHPLNADYLHGLLMSRAMPERDAGWGIRIYYELGEQHALDRLLRWAARGPYPDCPDEVLRLAGLTIGWTLSSPNRFLRDYATKALRQLLHQRLAVLGQVIDAFARVDDPYITERLAVIAHGSLLTGGKLDSQGAVDLARKAKEVMLDNERVPNLLTRDAIRGCFEWAVHAELIDQEQYESVCPPYGSEPPSKPRTKKQLERAYERRKKDKDGNYVRSDYGRLFHSLFDLGDFGRYVAESKAHRFTKFPLSKKIPAEPPAPPPRDRSNLDAFFDGLDEAVHEALVDGGPEAFQAVLSDSERARFHELVSEYKEPPPRRKPQRWTTLYPGDVVRCWIFERVIELGWTPEAFASFEANRLYEASRTSHKAERFGKKYQWIALRELLARIADNFHMAPEWGGAPRIYKGPWQFYGRDIDPTLPPPTRRRGDDDEVQLGPTFVAGLRGSWWDPDGPRFMPDDPPVERAWGTQVEGIPEFDALIKRTDPDGATWVVLQAYYTWDEEGRDYNETWSGPRRNMWSHVYSWMVAEHDVRTLVSALSERSLMGEWMPQGSEITSTAYLGEMPWAQAALEYPREWEIVTPHYEDEVIAVSAYAAADRYLWEGGGRDCSLNESAAASMPAPLLFDQGGLTWRPGTRDWYDASGKAVARYVTIEDTHSALLVDERWLRSLLRANGCALVVGWLGEKQLFDTDTNYGLVGDWIEMNGIAQLTASGWTLQPARLKVTDHRGDRAPTEPG
jgi:hypothetical protein